MIREEVVQFHASVPTLSSVVESALDRCLVGGSNPSAWSSLLCGRSVADRGAHNAFVTGSIPVRTTNGLFVQWQDIGLSSRERGVRFPHRSPVYIPVVKRNSTLPSEGRDRWFNSSRECHTALAQRRSSALRTQRTGVRISQAVPVFRPVAEWYSGGLLNRDKASSILAGPTKFLRKCYVVQTVQERKTGRRLLSPQEARLNGYEVR